MLASHSSVASFVKSGRSWMGGTHHNCDEKKSLEKHRNAHRVGGKRSSIFGFDSRIVFEKKSVIS